VLVGVEVQEEVLDFIDDLFDPGVWSVDFVDDEHDGQSLLEGLSKDEPSLGEGPSAASTSRITASTMARPRSTSPRSRRDQVCR